MLKKYRILVKTKI